MTVVPTSSEHDHSSKQRAVNPSFTSLCASQVTKICIYTTNAGSCCIALHSQKRQDVPTEAMSESFYIMHVPVGKVLLQVKTKDF